MKSKFYRSLSLLFAAVFASVSLMAQPGWNKGNAKGNDDYKDRRYEDRRYDDNRYDEKYDDRYDGRRERSYGKDNRSWRNKDRDGYYENGRYVIRHKLKTPHVNPGRKPSPYHVWAGGEWIYSRGQYVYQPGHWTMPSRGTQYIPGHWEKVRKGWYWEPGYWARPNRW